MCGPRPGDTQLELTPELARTPKNAALRRYRFGKRSEQVGSEPGLFLEDAVDADIAAMEQGLIDLSGS